MGFAIFLLRKDSSARRAENLSGAVLRWQELALEGSPMTKKLECGGVRGVYETLEKLTALGKAICLLIVLCSGV